MVSTMQRLRFRIALWCWARLLPLLAYRRDLQSLLALTAPAARKPYSGLAAAYVAKRVKRAGRKPWFMRDRICLRDGLLGYRFLRLAGYEPELHFGVDRTSVTHSRLSAHCWLVLDNVALLNPPGPNLVEMLVYRSGPGGTTLLQGINPLGQVTD
jgi:hypothetical protein